MNYINKKKLNVFPFFGSKTTYLNKKCDRKIARVKKDPISGKNVKRLIFDPIYVE